MGQEFAQSGCHLTFNANTCQRTAGEDRRDDDDPLFDIEPYTVSQK